MADRNAAGEPFTWKRYAASMDAALASGYQFIGFAGLTDSSRLPDCPFVLLRHDIDYEPLHAQPLAEIEATRGVQATYFFQEGSRFYDLWSPDAASVIQGILSQGHWLGLHFDANGVSDDRMVVERVEAIALRMEARFTCPVGAVSFHMPTYRPISHLKLRNGRVNTYAPLFFQEVEYISDSNQECRGKDVLMVFREATVRRLQVLIHPIWWRAEQTPLSTKMAALAARLGLPLDDILTAEQRATMDRA